MFRWEELIGGLATGQFRNRPKVVMNFLHSKRLQSALLTIVFGCSCGTFGTFGMTTLAQEPRVKLETFDDHLVVRVDDQVVANYVWADPSIKRPYFANVRSRSGVQVTRNHPPQKQDRKDHAEMHPGIWLAFGDINGHDFWRNHGTVEHVGFPQKPDSKHGEGSFIEDKRYRNAKGEIICNEKFEFTFKAERNGYLMVFESTFSGSQSFTFGDQEEMGLGIRVATPITELSGGRLVDGQGRKGAKQIWSQSANWCDYSGLIEGRPIGVTLFCSPDNFRDSWFHARNYGLLVANPFGRKAMKKGEKSAITLNQGEALTLQYAVWIHEQVNAKTIEAVFQDYVASLSEGDQD